MRFEHVIEINSAQAAVQAMMTRFSRDQLWRGLMLRVRAPERFPNGPAAVECTDVAEGQVRRVLHFGPHTLQDEVRIEPLQRLVFTPEAHGELAPIRLTISVEEPVPGQLVLRFVYEALAELSAEEAYYSGYRHNAWLHNDRDMVGQLREWLDTGELEALTH